MSEYYAVQRSTDHLAHYGVKGMKWGVRKAIAYGNQKALDKHFQKAAKKLAKLQDIGLYPKKYAAKSAAYGVAAIGTGTLVTPKGMSRVLGIRAGGKVGSYSAMNNTNWRPSGTQVFLAKHKKKIQMGLAPVAIGLGAASALNGYRAANASKYRSKAVSFRNAMDEVFSGTKYAGQYVAPPRQRKRKRR